MAEQPSEAHTRIEGLDLLRGIAIALVLARHAWPGSFGGGGIVGVAAPGAAGGGSEMKRGGGAGGVRNGAGAGAVTRGFAIVGG
jgi:peptidoglycan/LPS O-acetylase OafA/YrhL